MSARHALLAISFVLLCLAAGMFYLLAIYANGYVYAPGSSLLRGHFGGAFQHLRTTAVPHHYEKDLTPGRVLRKLYSVIAFAVVGLFAAPFFRRNRRALLCTFSGAAFSTTIEIGQKLTYGHESFASNLFDIGCGALGGYLGALAWNAFSAKLAARRARRQ